MYICVKILSKARLTKSVYIIFSTRIEIINIDIILILILFVRHIKRRKHFDFDFNNKIIAIRKLYQKGNCSSMQGMMEYKIIAATSIKLI